MSNLNKTSNKGSWIQWYKNNVKNAFEVRIYIQSQEKGS